MAAPHCTLWVLALVLSCIVAQETQTTTATTTGTSTQTSITEVSSTVVTPTTGTVATTKATMKTTTTIPTTVTTVGSCGACVELLRSPCNETLGVCGPCVKGVGIQFSNEPCIEARLPNEEQPNGGKTVLGGAPSTKTERFNKVAVISFVAVGIVLMLGFFIMRNRARSGRRYQYFRSPDGTDALDGLHDSANPAWSDEEDVVYARDEAY